MRKSKRNREAKRRESREREARSEILCRELARLRARSIPVGISCSQTYGDSRNGKDRNRAEGKGNGEETGAGTAANLHREVWVLADLIRTTATAKAVKLARRKNRSAKRGAKYFAGNLRDCEQGQYPWVLAARRHMAIVATVKTEIARRERETARKRARELRRICTGKCGY